VSGQDYDENRDDDRNDQYPPDRSGLGGELSSDERTWGMLAHLSALIAGLAGLSFLGPLIVMLTKGKEYLYVDHHAKEALNFQITVYLAVIVCIPLVLIFIGILLIMAVSLGALILTIIAAVKANEGVMYRYPFCIRFVK
jgi:uncharacterized Tic20 family protein